MITAKEPTTNLDPPIIWSFISRLMYAPRLVFLSNTTIIPQSRSYDRVEIVSRRIPGAMPEPALGTLARPVIKYKK